MQGRIVKTPDVERQPHKGLFNVQVMKEGILHFIGGYNAFYDSSWWLHDHTGD